MGVCFWFQVGGPLRFAVPRFGSAAVWHNNSGCSKAVISINEGVGETFVRLPTVMFVYQILLPSVIAVSFLLPEVVTLNGGRGRYFQKLTGDNFRSLRARVLCAGWQQPSCAAASPVLENCWAAI